MSGVAHTCPYGTPGFFPNCNACVIEMQRGAPKGSIQNDHPGYRRSKCVAPESCLACDRLGYHLEPIEPCPTCEGRGGHYCPEPGHWYECKECKGSKVVPRASEVHQAGGAWTAPAEKPLEGMKALLPGGARCKHCYEIAHPDFMASYRNAPGLWDQPCDARGDGGDHEWIERRSEEARVSPIPPDVESSVRANAERKGVSAEPVLTYLAQVYGEGTEPRSGEALDRCAECKGSGWLFGGAEPRTMCILCAGSGRTQRAETACPHGIVEVPFASFCGLCAEDRSGKAARVEDSELFRQLVRRYSGLGEIEAVVRSDLHRLVEWARSDHRGESALPPACCTCGARKPLAHCFDCLNDERQSAVRALEARDEARQLLVDVADDCAPPEMHFRCVVCGANHTADDDGDPTCSVAKALHVTLGLVSAPCASKDSDDPAASADRAGPGEGPVAAAIASTVGRDTPPHEGPDQPRSPLSFKEPVVLHKNTLGLNREMLAPAVERARKVLFEIDNACMNAKAPRDDRYEAVRAICIRELFPEGGGDGTEDAGGLRPMAQGSSGGGEASGLLVGEGVSDARGSDPSEVGAGRGHVAPARTGLDVDYLTKCADTFLARRHQGHEQLLFLLQQVHDDGKARGYATPRAAPPASSGADAFPVGTKVLVPTSLGTANSRLGKVVEVSTRIHVKRADGTVGHFTADQLEHAHHCWEPDCEACVEIERITSLGEDRSTHPRTR